MLKDKRRRRAGKRGGGGGSAPPTERKFPHTDSLFETSHSVFMFVFTAAKSDSLTLEN